MTPDTARAVYFVVAELLTNASKHGGCRSMEMAGTLRYDEPQRLRLTVCDDGRGSAVVVVEDSLLLREGLVRLFDEAGYVRRGPSPTRWRLSAR